MNGVESYRPSGRVDWPRFVPLAGVALGAAMAGSAVLFALYSWGMYFFVMMPALVSIAVVQAARMPIFWGACRSRFLGVSLAVAMATLLYVGQYYCHFLSAFGLEHAHRVDHLPALIQWRLENDVVMDDHGKARQPSFVANVFFAAMDAIVVFGVLVGVSYPWLKRPYSEKAQKWMTPETLPLAAGEAEGLKDLVLAGDPAGLAAIAPLPFANPPYSEFTFYYVVNERGELADRMVLVAREIRQAKTKTSSPSNPTPIPLTVLNEEQSAAALARLPSLQAKIRPLPLTAVETASDGPGSFGHVVDAACPWWTTFREAPAVDLTTHRWYGTLFIVLAGGAAVSLLVGLWAVTRPEEERSMWVAAPCLALMFISGGLSTRVEDWHARSVARRVRERVMQRPDRLVDPQGSDTFFAEYTPRFHWKAANIASDAEDYGYLRVDPHRRQLLYEGDRFRWRIDGSAIVKCQIEMKNSEKHMENPVHHDPIYVLVLEVRTGEEVREIPFKPLDATVEGGLPKESYPRSEMLAARIQTILVGSESAPGTP